MNDHMAGTVNKNIVNPASAGAGALIMFFVGRKYAKGDIKMQVLGVVLGGTVGYLVSDAVFKVKEQWQT